MTTTTGRRVAYVKRSDGIIQRVYTRQKAPLSREVTKADYEAYRAEREEIDRERRRERRVAKAAAAEPRVGDTYDRTARSRAPAPRKGKPPAHLVTYETFFLAYGGSVPGPEKDPAGFYQEGDDGPANPPPGMVAGPRAFYTNSGLMGFGRTKWPGVKPLEELIDELNFTLNIVDKNGRHRDFRSVYPRWSYRWIVVEKLRTGGGERVVQDVSRGR